MSNWVSLLAASGWLYPIVIIIAILLVYVFNCVFHIVLRLTNYLGEYQKTPLGFERTKYRLQIIVCYAALSFPVYLTVLSLVQLSPQPKIVDYIWIFAIMLSFLISIRLLANPTIPVFRFWYRRNPFEQTTITDHDRETIHYIKDQVISFFAALIIGGIFIDVIGIFFSDSQAKLTSNLNGLTASTDNLIVFFIVYAIALFILGLFSEWFLEYTQVIEV